MPFSYENKSLAQHWTTHNRRIHWPVAYTTQTWIHECRHFKQMR